MHPFIQLYLKGEHNLCPSLRKYQFTWDIDNVHQYMNKIPATDNLSIQTSHADCTHQGTIHLMRLDNMQVSDDTTRFIISDHVKQSRPAREQPVLVLPKYTVNNMCTVATFKQIYQ